MHQFNLFKSLYQRYKWPNLLNIWDCFNIIVLAHLLLISKDSLYYYKFFKKEQEEDMQCNMIKKITIQTIITAVFLIGYCSMAHAYGGGDKDPVSSSSASGSTSTSKKSMVEGLSPADAIRIFGTQAMKDTLERVINDRKNKLAKANKRSEKLKAELNKLREKIRQAAIRIKNGDNSMEAEEEYLNSWKKAINKQYAAKKAEADRLVALKNAERAEDGLKPISSTKEKNIRDYVKKDADSVFVANQVKFMDKVLKHGQNAFDEADERDRQIMRWTVVKYASMAGSAGLGGVAIAVKAGQLGIAALSATEATKLLTIAAAMDVGGAGIGAAADSHINGKSAAESLIRGLSASGVQALAGKILGKIPDSATIARNSLIGFVQSVGVDELQSALQGIPDKLKKTGGSAPPPSAPNYEPPVYTQQHAM